jgi:ubiquinone/menaquinone biosynthesis C-methylase UbiE
MFEIDKFLAATPKELEGLSWYEIISKLGLLSFNSQGIKPIELIAKLTRIIDSSAVLIVGCGAGGTAVHLAEITGAMVYGIDISPESIRMANSLALKSSAHNRLHFQIGDAHALSFPPNTFNVVITEFMAFFLQQSAFEGFSLVLKSSGQIALAELMKDPKVNAKANAKILVAEETYSDLLGYKFHIPLVTEYIESLTQVGFKHVHIEEKFFRPNFHEEIKNAGGWKNLYKISKIALKLIRESPVLRKKFLQSGLMKRVIYQDRSTAKYIFQAIMIGRKS